MHRSPFERAEDAGLEQADGLGGQRWVSRLGRGIVQMICMWEVRVVVTAVVVGLGEYLRGVQRFCQ